MKRFDVKYVGPGASPIQGAEIYGKIAVAGTQSAVEGLIDYSTGGWVAGVKSDKFGHVIVGDTTSTYDVTGRTTGGGTGVVSSEPRLRFWKCEGKTDQAFLDLVNSVPVDKPSVFTDASVADIWLKSNGFYSSYSQPDPLAIFQISAMYSTRDAASNAPSGLINFYQESGYSVAEITSFYTGADLVNNIPTGLLLGDSDTDNYYKVTFLLSDDYYTCRIDTSGMVSDVILHTSSSESSSSGSAGSAGTGGSSGSGGNGSSQFPTAWLFETMDWTLTHLVSQYEATQSYFGYGLGDTKTSIIAYTEGSSINVGSTLYTDATCTTPIEGIVINYLFHVVSGQPQLITTSNAGVVVEITDNLEMQPENYLFQARTSQLSKDYLEKFEPVTVYVLINSKTPGINSTVTFNPYLNYFNISGNYGVSQNFGADKSYLRTEYIYTRDNGAGFADYNYMYDMSNTGTTNSSTITSVYVPGNRDITVKYNPTFDSIISGGTDQTITINMDTYELSGYSKITSSTTLQSGGALNDPSGVIVYKIGSAINGVPTYDIEAKTYFKYGIGQTRSAAIDGTNYLTLSWNNRQLFLDNGTDLCDLTQHYDVTIYDTLGNTYSHGDERYLSDGVHTRGVRFYQVFSRYNMVFNATQTNADLCQSI